MIPKNNNRFARLAAIAGLLATTGTAYAMSTTTTPTDWRFTSSTAFNGVNFNGVARIFSDTDGNLYNGDSVSVCSGTLLSGGQYVLTAAHCADNFNVMRVDFGVNNNVPTIMTGVSAAYLNPGWTGALGYGADIAIIKLDQIVSTISGFNLNTQNALGKTVLMMGYGTTGTGSASTEPDWSDWGYGHWGMNTYDITCDTLGTSWDYGCGENTYGEEYVADFDDGTAGSNSLQWIADNWNNSWTSGYGVTDGTKLYEALISGGDSGGGDFFWNGSEWLLSGVHSWGWDIWCDTSTDPNCKNSSSYGDLMGSTAVYSHIDWIDSIINRVPEPGTLPLMVVGLFAAFGLGRRRKLS